MKYTFALAAGLDADDASAERAPLQPRPAGAGRCCRNVRTVEASEPDESTVAAAAEFTVRLCVGERRADDPRVAMHLVARLHGVRSAGTDGRPDDPAEVDDAVFGAVTGAVWAAFPGLLGDPDEAAWVAVAACADSRTRREPVDRATDPSRPRPSA